MQSWNNAGGQQANPNGQSSSDPQIQWQQQDFNFAPQNGQFDPNTDWNPQHLHDPNAFAQQLNTSHENSANLFDSLPQGSEFLQHRTQTQETGFHGGSSSVEVNQHQQYQQQPQESLDPAFQNINPELYNQHPKSSIQDGLGQASQPSFTNQGRSPNLGQRDFSYAPPHESLYQDHLQAPFGQHPVVQQQGHQQAHNGLSQHYQQMHHQAEQSPAQGAPSFTQAPQYQQPPNGGDQLYQISAQSTSQQQPQQRQSQPQHQQQSQPHYQASQHPQAITPAYTQSQFALSSAVPYQNAAYGEQQPSLQSLNHASISGVARPGVIQSPAVEQVGSPALSSVSADAPAKKRKRTVKTATELPENAGLHAELQADASSSRPAEIDSLPPPTQTPEEVDLSSSFSKRPASAKAKFPAIKGLPYLVHAGSIKLPTPKSYDKLAPMVALAPRSGNPMVPGLPYELPCQIQGRFSSQYQPSPDKSGLDERRMEAKPLLDAYDRSMKAIGKRQPKYTEYPHAFKEQLKADEANKNKGKKLNKEGPSKPIRAETRPANAVEAAVWDVLGIVHVEPTVTRSTQLIASRVQQAGDFFIKLRGDMNRAKQELDQAQTKNGSEDEILKLTKTLEQMKKALYKSLDAVIEHADDSVLDNMGGHQKFISSLVNVLIFCIKTGDFSGKLPKVALEMFTHMPMTKKIAETSSFETVRKRFAEKGDEEVKGLAKEIASQVKKLKPAEPEPTGYTGTSNRPKVTKPAEAPTNKRVRDEEGGDSRSVKKVVVEAGNSSLAKKLTASKLPPGANKIPMVKATGPSILGNKPRAVSVNKIPAKTESPPTSTDDRAKLDTKKQAKPEVKPAASKPTPSTAPSALSGIGSLLASISTSKPEKTALAPKEEKKPNTAETPEQKAKRLRKEARRNLRVTWKPESELVKVKVFEKEDSEDEGRAHNMIKDAADDRSEGMMLKRGVAMDEEDDDDDIPYVPWEEPVKADCTGVPEERRNKHFVTRGGNVSFTTDEQQWIKDREQKELMVLYTHPDDIPPTPKSPPPQSAASGPALKQARLPQREKFNEIHQRWRDEEQMGVDGALYSAMQRLRSQAAQSKQIDGILGRVTGSIATPQQSGSTPMHSAASTQPNHPPLAVGLSVIDSVLGWLRSDQVKHSHDAKAQTKDIRVHRYSDSPTQVAGTAIEALVRYLSAKPYPATSPPDWLLNDEERVREWWLGYNKEVAARQKREADVRARVEAEEVARRAAAAATTAPNQNVHQGQDWAAWLAQIQQQQQSQGPAQQQQQQDYAPYLAMIQQMQQQQQQSGNSQAQGDQLQAILAAMGQGQSNLTHQAAAPAPYSQANDAYAQIMQLAQMAQGGQQQPPAPPASYAAPSLQQPPSSNRDWELNYDDAAHGERHRDNAREWDRNEDSYDPDSDWDRDNQDRDWDQKEGGGKGTAKKRTLPPHKPFNKALIGTKSCTFWQQGKCARGDKCTFRHD